MKRKYNAIIIGAGSIGALKDSRYDGPRTKNILTIAHAMYQNKDINLVGILDKDYPKAMAAAKKWETEFYGSIGTFNKMVEFAPIDIVAVCTPTETHHQVLKEVINEIYPKIIIAEKPFCANKEQAKEIVRLCKRKNIILVIDYIRRYDSSTGIIAATLRDAEIYNVTVQYNRGFMHEACHAIDLMNFWFGKCKKVSIPSKRQIVDRSTKDPAAFVCCEHERATVLYLPVDGREYSIFEITITTSKGKIVLTDHGKLALFYQRIPEPTYGDYYTLSSQPLRTETELTIALGRMVEECAAMLDCKADDSAFICTGKDALAVHEIFEQYKKLRSKK